jgi:ribosomal protein S18 acetylase RimI-like enzyme
MRTTSNPAADASPAPFTIRLARLDEHPAVAALTARAFAAGPYGHLPVSPERRALVDAVGVRAATGEVLVAAEGGAAEGGGDGVLLGTVSVLRADSPHARLAQDDEAEVRLLGVAPEFRGRGVGEALMLAAHEVALGWGASAVVLDTGAENAASQRLYERLGYEVFGPTGGGGGWPGGGRPGHPTPASPTSTTACRCSRATTS